MKKTLMISLVNGNYLIKSDGDKETTVNGDDLILNGKALYDAFFFDVKIGEQLEFSITIDDSVVGGRETHIAGDIKKILENIVDKINDSASELESVNEQQ